MFISTLYFSGTFCWSDTASIGTANDKLYFVIRGLGFSKVIPVF